MPNNKDFIVKNNARLRGGKLWLKDTTTEAGENNNPPANQQHVYLDGSDGNLTISSDNIIQFHESDNSTRRVVFDLNDNKYSFGDSSNEGTTDTQSEMFHVTGSGRFGGDLNITGDILGRVSSEGSATADSGNSHSLVNNVFLNPSPEAGGAIDIRTVNELAGLEKWGSISAVSGFYLTRTNAGSSESPNFSYSSEVTSITSGNMFDGVASTAGSWFTDNGTDGTTAGTGTFTLSFAGKKQLDYTCYVGIVFGSTSFVAKKVKIEVYRGGTYANDAYSGGSWTTICDLTTNSDVNVSRRVQNNSTNGVQQIKYTLGGNNTASSTYFRVQDVYALDHDAGANSGPKGIHYVRRYGDSDIYGNLLPATDSTYTLGDSDQFFSGVYSDKIYLNDTADTTATDKSALFLDGTEVKKRTLGSNAFSSTSFETVSNVGTYFARGFKDYESATEDLAVGWYTIATINQGRASARFSVWDAHSSRHQTIHFYASHHYGTDASNNITVIHASNYNTTEPVRHIRIKELGTYDGAALQVYVEQGANLLHVAAFDDVQGETSQGWVLKNFIADGTDPGGVSLSANSTNGTTSAWSSFTEAAKVDLQNIYQGGIATTGEIYAGGRTTQYKYLNTNSSAADFPTLNQDTTGTATNATNVAVTANNSTDETNYLTFGAGGANSGNLGLETDTALNYNPSTDVLTAGTFAGTLKGEGAVHYVEGNTSGTAGTWTGTNTNIGSYYNGLIVAFKHGVAGASTTTLNINSLGAKTVYRYNSTKLTTHIPVGTTINYVYDSSSDAFFAMTDIDQTLQYELRWASHITAGATIHGRQLIMEGSDGKFYPVTSGGANANTNTVSTQTMRMGGLLLLYESSTDRAADAVWAADVWESRETNNLEYWTNHPTSEGAWGTAGGPLYLVGTEDANGHFVLDNTSATSFLAQALPSSDDGKIYIHLGYFGDTTNTDNLRFTINNPMYQYINGQVQPYTAVPRKVTVTDNESANENDCIAFVANAATATGDHGLEMDGDFTYNPGTGTVAATNLSLTSADAGAGQGPTITLTRNSASPAASDGLGILNFVGKDADDNDTTYASIKSKITFPNSGQEYGTLEFCTVANAAEKCWLTLDGNTIKASSASFTLENTANGAGTDPVFIFNSLGRDADNERLGEFQFRSVNDNDEDIIYASISSKIIDISDSTEQGELTVNIRNNSASKEVVNIQSDTVQFNTNNFKIVSTDDDSTVDPELLIFRDSASPTANDNIGRVSFRGNNADGQVATYAYIQGHIVDPTTNSKDGKLTFGHLNGNATTVALTLSGTTADFGTNTVKAKVLDLHDQTTGSTTTAGPLLKLHRDTAANQNHMLGRVSFEGDNDAQEVVEYGFIQARITDVSTGDGNGTETGSLKLGSIQNGSAVTSLDLTGDTATIRQSLMFDASFASSRTDSPSIEFKLVDVDSATSVVSLTNDCFLSAYGFYLLDDNDTPQLGNPFATMSGDSQITATVDKLVGNDTTNYVIDLRDGSAGGTSRIPNGMTFGRTNTHPIVAPFTNGYGYLGQNTKKWDQAHIEKIFVTQYIDLADSDYISFGTSDDAKFFYDGSNNDFELELESACGDFLITDNGNTRFTFAKSTGAFTATGNITAFSDARLKTEVKTLDPNKTLQMRGVEFIKDGEKGSGVIAQELEKVAPELVLDGKDGYKSVAYGNLTGYLIETVKEQQKQIDELKELVQKLLEK